MTMLTGGPASLSALARNDLERNSPYLFSVNFESVTNTVRVVRGAYPDSPRFSTTISLTSEDSASWKYAVGSENVPYLIALKALGEDGAFRNLKILSTYWEAYSPTRYYAFDEATGSSNSTLDTAFRNALNAVYDSSSKLNSSDEQFIYGDRTFLSFANQAPIYDDVLVGQNGNDVLLGLLGKDVLKGGLGHDELYGGYGNDRLEGEDGSDTLHGQENSDSLYGGSGNDYLDGGLGSDYMSGGAGNDTYIVDNAGDQIVDDGLATDLDTVLMPIYLNYALAANIENARLTGNHDGGVTGNANSNRLTGNDGDNKISGASGKDTLIGGDGGDVLVGGAGMDSLRGGADADIFDFNALTELGTSSSTDDVISDFTVGQDKIDLSTIGANLSLSGDQAFSFVASFTTKAGQVRYSGGIVHLNTDTDSLTDYQIRLVGVVPEKLTAADFFL